MFHHAGCFEIVLYRVLYQYTNLISVILQEIMHKINMIILIIPEYL